MNKHVLMFLLVVGVLSAGTDSSVIYAEIYKCVKDDRTIVSVR
ncbi:hypothetical protein [Hahella ganghwensis]|nr:hypothetical protein [Hahella ganghwensis]